MKPCFCGSGKPRRANHDARGIFMTYTCDDCHKQKMSGFRPEVLSNPNYYPDEPIDD